MRKMIALAAVLSAFALAAPAASAAGTSGKYCLKGPGAQMNCRFETMAACNDNKQDTQTCVPRTASTTGSGMGHSKIDEEVTLPGAAASAARAFVLRMRQAPARAPAFLCPSAPVGCAGLPPIGRFRALANMAAAGRRMHAAGGLGRPALEAGEQVAKTIRAEWFLGVSLATTLIFCDRRPRAVCRAHASARLRAHFRLAVRRGAGLGACGGAPCRPHRGGAGRALRHARSHAFGHGHRGHEHFRRDAARRQQPDAGARYAVRRRHDHPGRHGRRLAADRRLAPPRAALQSAGRQRLSRRDHPARGVHAQPAELHRDDRRADAVDGAADLSRGHVARPLRHLPRHPDRPPPRLFHGRR